MRKALLITALFILGLCLLPEGGASAVSAVKIDSQLTRFFATHATDATVPVVITYKQKPGTTSTGTGARAQILIGTSATGGLLLNSDSASGSDFKVE